MSTFNISIIKQNSFNNSLTFNFFNNIVLREHLEIYTLFCSLILGIFFFQTNSEPTCSKIHVTNLCYHNLTILVYFQPNEDEHVASSVLKLNSVVLQQTMKEIGMDITRIRK
jgi:hypothetical protein